VTGNPYNAAQCKPVNTIENQKIQSPKTKNPRFSLQTKKEKHKKPGRTSRQQPSQSPTAPRQDREIPTVQKQNQNQEIANPKNQNNSRYAVGVRVGVCVCRDHAKDP
jgi:hypothetical protein